MLEKYLASSNIQARLEYQLKEANDLNNSMKDRLYELEKEREEFRARLGFSPEQKSLSESQTSNYPPQQRSML